MANAFAQTCERLGIARSAGRVGSAHDNAVAESFNSTLEWELLSRRRFATKDQARRAVANWIDQIYNPRRRHRNNEMMSPIGYDKPATASVTAATVVQPAVKETLHE